MTVSLMTSSYALGNVVFCIVLFRAAGAIGKGGVISVNYDGFIDDVSVGDELLVDGGIISFVVRGKTDTDVEVRLGEGEYELHVCTTQCVGRGSACSLGPVLQGLPINGWCVEGGVGGCSKVQD